MNTKLGYPVLSYEAFYSPDNLVPLPYNRSLGSQIEIDAELLVRFHQVAVSLKHLTSYCYILEDSPVRLRIAHAEELCLTVVGGLIWFLSAVYCLVWKGV